MEIPHDSSGNFFVVSFQRMCLSGFISLLFGSLLKLIVSNNLLMEVIPPKIVNLSHFKVLVVSNDEDIIVRYVGGIITIGVTGLTFYYACAYIEMEFFKYVSEKDMMVVKIMIDTLVRYA